MTSAQLSLSLFVVCNGLRIVAFVPQMAKLARCPGRAAGFSYATWAMFGAANASTALYAGCFLADAPLAAANFVSAVFCACLIALAAWRSRSHADSSSNQKV